MVPVDHVARCAALGTIDPLQQGAMSVLHITSRPPVTYNDLLTPLSRFGYSVEKCDYVMWRMKLEQHVLEVQDNALFPLLYFVLDDLPSNTKSAELDDKNTKALLSRERGPLNMTVDLDLMSRYLSWLVSVGFLTAPSGTAEIQLPELAGFTTDMKAIGRSGRV